MSKIVFLPVEMQSTGQMKLQLLGRSFPVAWELVLLYSRQVMFLLGLPSMVSPA